MSDQPETDALCAALEAAGLINTGGCPDCEGVGEDENANFWCEACKGQGTRVIPDEEFERRADDDTLRWMRDRDCVYVTNLPKAAKILAGLNHETNLKAHAFEAVCDLAFALIETHEPDNERWGGVRKDDLHILQRAIKQWNAP